MHLWLIKTGTPLPIDGQNVRLFREAILAEQIVKQGNEVTWWTATFNHQRKRQRYDVDTVVELSSLYRLRLIHSGGYEKNISLARIRDHQELAGKFARQVRTLPVPDIILAALPIPSLCLAAGQYGHKNGVPVVLDIRDLWPDVFLDIVPNSVRWLARRMLQPLRRTTEVACTMATAIVGITPQYVEWGLRHAGRKATSRDRHFAMGYTAHKPEPSDAKTAYEFWAQRGVVPERDDFIACFFGNLGHQFEIEPILDAARLMLKDRRKIRFVFCGEGDKLSHYQKKSADLPNVQFAGFVGQSEIWAMMQMSSVGLAPYFSNGNFIHNIPNKPAEYFSGCLPVLSSLQGALAELLQKWDCGLTYKNGCVDQIVEMLRCLHDNPYLRNKMAANACKLYKERFVAENIYAEMARYLERLADDCRRAG